MTKQEAIKILGVESFLSVKDATPRENAMASLAYFESREATVRDYENSREYKMGKAIIENLPEGNNNEPYD